MKVPFEWESIESYIGQESYRVKVESGWLVKHVVTRCNQPVIMTMTFVPDPQHNWEIETIKDVPNPGINEFYKSEAAYSQVKIMHDYDTPMQAIETAML